MTLHEHKIAATLSHRSGAIEARPEDNRRDTKSLTPSVVELISGKLALFFRGNSGLQGDLPPTISHYRFEREIFNGNRNRFRYGIYADGNGNRVVAKQWTGRSKNLNYYWLNNEIDVYYELDNLYRRHGKELEARFPRVRIPKLLHVKRERHRLILIVEKIDGSHPHTGYLDNDETMYDYLIEYFAFVGELIQRKTPHSLSRRNTRYIIGVFPFMLLRAIVKHPRFVWTSLKAAGIFVRSIPSLLQQTALTFAHRDIKPLNVFMRNALIYPIDFELAVLTHPMVDLIHGLLRSWHRPDARAAVLHSRAMRRVLQDKSLLKTYRSLSIYSAVIEIALSKKNETSHALSYLNHILTLRHTL